MGMSWGTTRGGSEHVACVVNGSYEWVHAHVPGLGARVVQNQQGLTLEKPTYCSVYGAPVGSEFGDHQHVHLIHLFASRRDRIRTDA